MNGYSSTQKNELPPCSEFLKDGVDLTTQSFIMDARIPNLVPWRSGSLKGDGRRFLDSPADLVENTYRGSNSITVSPDGSVTRNANYDWTVMYDNNGNETGRMRANASFHWSAGSRDKGGTYTLGSYSSAGEPFDAWITNLVAPIQIAIGGAMDPSTGVFEYSASHTRFPSFQVFVNGVNVYNSTQSRYPVAIMGPKKRVGGTEKLCDPEK